MIIEAETHNRTVLAHLAAYVINAPDEDRRRLFASLCSEAVERYDRLGSMMIEPPGQLAAWAIWA